MSGTAAIMAPAVEPSSSTFSRRSYSSPSLPSLASLTHGQPMSQNRFTLDGRSLASISTFEIPSFDSDFELDTSLFLNSKILSSDKSTTSPTPIEKNLEEPSTATQRARPASSLANRPRSWMPGFRAPRDTQNEEQRRPATSTRESYFSDGRAEFSDPQPPLERSQAASETFATFAKRSWITSGRSTSPKSRPDSPADKPSEQDDATSDAKMKPNTTPKHLEIATNQIDQRQSPDPAKPASKAFARASSYLAKIRQKPASTLSRTSESIGSNGSCASSATSLAHPASDSVDTRASRSTYSETNPTTDDSSGEMPPRMSDPLWSSFKTLEMEFRSFASKSMPQRIGQIQSLVLPFLKSAMGQASLKNLRPEDVDRRATILNKWWGGVLDVLDGQYQQPVAGVDRPILLEAATLIMMRPEWRQTTSYFMPLSERSPSERVRTRSGTNSSNSSHSSSQSVMLAESAEHNVRTMFVSNLVKQMAFVVEKMSLRHAPLSLVNFAGKTCAYAFFFAPGVADILVRLWGLTPDLIRRTSDEFALPRKDSGESDDITALFPPKLCVFGWTSPRAMWDTLKHIPKMPMLVARIPWTGPWVSRWKGRDTDLFFIFCKYFHVLSDQFMPCGLPLTEKARSPAFVLVHAQLLSLMDTTIHRQSALDAAYGSPMMDAIQGPDAAALAMPVPTNNLMKGMSENRLVILLKDILSDDAAKFEAVKHTFAQAFAALLKGATCRTSRHNSTSCFTLCDFLEEVLAIYNDFESTNRSTGYVDWNFWFDVCKKILSSMNTMSEVRMLSFLFTIWDAVAKDPRRKLSLCRDWLLTEETFNAFFNNWCPMVRAYYQRLLCWRICRDKGSPNEVDLEIFLIISERLKMVWSHYLYVKHSAEDAGRIGPSTAPMSPVLGKKFIIIRQEVLTAQPGLFMGFDSFARTTNADWIPGDGISDSLMSKNEPKKRWSLLGKVLSLTSGQGSSADAVRQSMDDELQIARREIAEARKRTGAPAPPPKSSKSGSDSGRSTPVFDEQKFTFKFILGWQQPPMPPRERVLVRPRLPTPAQARVSVRSRNGSPPPPPPSIPAPMRSFSGSSHGGLVQAARNASPLSSPTSERRRRSSVSTGRGDESLTRSSSTTDSGTATPSEDRFSSPSGIQFDTNQERVMEPTIEPVKPTGVFAKTAIYSGRALAEWSLVVAECNNFVERRRDDGVLGLSEVEVPHLGVEGFRRAGG